MEPDVGIRLGEYIDTKTGASGVCLEVTNVGQVTIDELKLDFVYEYEKPQPEVASPSIPGKKPIPFEQTGGSLGFGLEVGQEKGPIKPGEQRLYLYPTDAMPMLKSLVESLSPERYHVRVTVNGKREVGIPGSVFGELVGRVFKD